MEGAHMGGHLLVQLPVNQAFYDCPLAPGPLQLHLTKRYKLAGQLHVDRRKKRGWMRLSWDAAWPHMH